MNNPQTEKTNKITSTSLHNRELLRKRLEDQLARLRTEEGWLLTGLPRFPRLYGRDSCITSLELMEYDPSIARATVLALAENQGVEENIWRGEEPGKIPHEVANGFWDRLNAMAHWGFFRHFPYYGSIDATPLWLIVIAEYYKKTKDEELVNMLWPNIERALKWMEIYGDRDGDGLLEYERRNPIAGLKHQAWKDGVAEARHMKMKFPVAAVEVQGYAYNAYMQIAYLAQMLRGDIEFAKKLHKFAEKLQTRFRELFWLEDEQFFAFAVDGEKKPVRSVTSNVGHLLFTGILNAKETDAVVRRLFTEDMLTPYGIRTLSAEDKDFSLKGYHRGTVWPHDNWITYTGLVRSGKRREAEDLRKRVVLALMRIGYGYEFFGVDLENSVYVPKKASMPQAWAVGAFLNLLISEKPS